MMGFYVSLRDAFLSRFDSLRQPHIVEFGKRITAESINPNTVLLFMARKAACFADCLETLHLASYNCPVTSDRVLDLNATWLRNKRIVIIDDALISGTTIYRTIEKLHHLGVPDSNIKVIVLCVNKDWYCPDLVRPEKPYLLLDDDATAYLCASIVDAMSIIPRPYDVDFPLFKRLEVTEDYLPALMSIPGWEIDDISSPIQTAHGVISATFSPDINTLELLDEILGWSISKHALLKVRLYGRLKTRYKRVFACNVLGVAANHPLSDITINELFHSLRTTVPQYSILLDEVFHNEHMIEDKQIETNLLSKARIVSYLIGAKLARLWFGLNPKNWTGIEQKHTVVISGCDW